MANPKASAWYGGGTNLNASVGIDAGNVFYVTSTGDDANNGLTPGSAFLTITAALDACVAGNQDYIYVLRYNNAHVGEAWPIVMDKSYVHLIGASAGHTHPRPQIVSADDAHGINITAGGCEIAGLQFGSTAANLKSCIHLDVNEWMTYIHDCWFAWSTEAYDCIYLGSQCPNVRICNCRFGAHGFTRAGIYTAQIARAIIEDNVFFVEGFVTGDYAIYVGNANNHSIIRNNVFQVPDAANGEAITMAAGTTAMIDGNHAFSGKVNQAGQTFNPYVDAGTNHWGLNYHVETPVVPA